MRHLQRLALIVCALICPALACAQSGFYHDIAISGAGRPLSNVSVSICSGITTSAASVTGNLATLTLNSNPITAGFTLGGTVVIYGFTGVDAYFNGTFTTTNLTATQVQFVLTHTNASAASVGSVVQQGLSACLPLANLFTDSSASNSSSNPFLTDGLGNITFYAAPGVYQMEYAGGALTPTVRPVVVDCAPNANNCGILTGSWTFVPAGSSLATAISGAATGSGLFVACGTYSISSTLTVSNPITIWGQAPSANFNIGGVQFGAYTPCVKILWTGASGTAMMDITNIIGVDIRNLTFDGNNLASIGLHTKGVNHSKFDGLTFTNFSVAGNANDAAWSSEGGDAGKTNVQWDYVSNIAFNGVVKGFHAWTANVNTDTATSIFDGMWCTLIGGASNYCFLLDSADNNDWRNLYGALQSGASGSFITLNDASGANNGARSNYFVHPSGNPSMTFVSNVAGSTGLNFVEGYDKSNGMPNVTGTHPESLAIFGSTDLTKMLTLPNQGRLNSWNAAGNTIIDLVRLDNLNNLIVHSSNSIQMWNSAENAITFQFNDTNASSNVPFFGQLTTVAALPNVVTFTGAYLVVTDSTAIAAEGQTCVGGSTTKALAFSNGAVWKCF